MCRTRLLTGSFSDYRNVPINPIVSELQLMKRRPKLVNLKFLIEQCLALGIYRFSDHANQRMSERKVNRPEVQDVLKSGHLEGRFEWQQN